MIFITSGEGRGFAFMSYDLQTADKSKMANDIGVRYYDSTTMSIRNTNGKDEETLRK